MMETIEYQNIYGNRKHKDSLFRKVFSKKKDLLALYNALNGTCYENEEDLEINTLDNALYMSVKNDVSCIIGCTMNLYEHQSSYNPNMPLRGLIYFAQQYNIYTEKRKLNLFSSKLQKIPTPQYVVFYNGLKSEPDRQILKLSDAFQTESGCLECEAIMLNINYGQNRELMEKCRRLEEYAIFIATVRKYAEDERLNLGDIITLAIDECMEKKVLLDILTEERAEVYMYILEAFDKEQYERDLIINIREEVREEMKSEVREEVKSEVREEMKSEVREEVKSEVREEVKSEVREEVKSEVREEVKKELRDELKKELIRSKLAKGKSVEQIADELEETREKIQNLILHMEKES